MIEVMWLFVAEIENLEISACIFSPQQVNFLMNGKGVERRSNVFMDDGPQLPTNVTKLLKYRTNLLQAVGQFNGNYNPRLYEFGDTSCSSQDYVQSTVALLNSVHRPCRVSLSCPIRIRGDQHHFVRGDELKAAWEIFSPLLHRIDNGEFKLIPYKRGSKGSEEADKLLDQIGYVQTHGYIWIIPTL